ncbi:MAG: tRNA (adenosine(37)-N6)-threonylcarbamoyltransferase complex ATPase subunit type 1 TsaE [Candidatus Kerfeldbacteria bacterium]|nr:tRNA (adenosine(37)-N6)-threonylcarbamoyltransferase complex ATPase subunit type 1 TsaE [Candidatus Kerfeldbacteria bacterium]
MRGVFVRGRTTKNPRDTERLGRAFAAACTPGLVVLCVGTLGSGKTTFLKGVARGLGVAEPIVSPTFVLHKRYPVRNHAIRALNHLDAYRLSSADELRGLLDEEIASAPKEVWFIEWGEKLLGALPPRSVQLRFTILGPTARRIQFVSPRRALRRGGRSA